MSNNPLPKLFSAFASEAFRLETLPQYAVEDEREELSRFLSGELFPTLTAHQAWLDALDGWRETGKQIIRVRVVPERKTPYLAFETEWGYRYNTQHGEQVFMIAEEDFKRRFGGNVHDWWMFDRKTAVVMNYGHDGSFAGADEVVSDGAFYRDVRDRVLDDAITLKAYLQRERS